MLGDTVLIGGYVFEMFIVGEEKATTGFSWHLGNHHLTGLLSKDLGMKCSSNVKSVVNSK